MNFCPNCDNLYIYANTPDNVLMLKCQNCGKTQALTNETTVDVDAGSSSSSSSSSTTSAGKEAVCVYLNKFVQHAYDVKMHPDQCHDPTLPHTRQVQCKNQGCPSNTDSKVLPDVVFLHYNDKLKLAYICCHCKTYWKN